MMWVSISFMGKEVVWKVKDQQARISRRITRPRGIRILAMVFNSAKLHAEKCQSCTSSLSLLMQINRLKLKMSERVLVKMAPQVVHPRYLKITQQITMWKMIVDTLETSCLLYICLELERDREIKYRALKYMLPVAPIAMLPAMWDIYGRTYGNTRALNRQRTPTTTNIRIVLRRMTLWQITMERSVLMLAKKLSMPAARPQQKANPTQKVSTNTTPYEDWTSSEQKLPRQYKLMMLGAYSRSMVLETLIDEEMNVRFSDLSDSKGLVSRMRGARRTLSQGLIRYSECRSAMITNGQPVQGIIITLGHKEYSLSSQQLVGQQKQPMNRVRNTSRPQPVSNFKMEIDSRNNSPDSPRKSTVRKMQVHSSLLHAQRNIKLIAKNQLKRQLMDPESRMDSLPRLKKEEERNHSTLDRESRITGSRLFEGSASSEFKTLKSLLSNVRESKKKERQKAMNLLGLQIKRIQPQTQSQCREAKYPVQTSNSVNLNGGHRSFSMVRIQDVFQQPSLVVDPTEEEVDQNDGYDKTIHTTDRKNLSLANSGAKYQYFHNKPPKTFKFSLSSEGYKIYERRLRLYKQFIFTVQMGHNVYLDGQLKGTEANTNGLYLKNQDKYKMWIGPGNNWLLIRSLMKRRYWWITAENKHLDGLNFMWTQLKVNSIFEKQETSGFQKLAAQLRKSQDEDETEENAKKRPHSLGKNNQKKEVQVLNQELYHKILNPEDKQVLRKYVQKHQAREKKNPKPMQYRHKNYQKPCVEIQTPYESLVHNHLQNNFFLGNKKAMFYNLKQYYELSHDNVFNYLPLTFHIRNGTSDIQYKRFQLYHKRRAAYIAKQEKLQQQKRNQSQSQEDQGAHKQKKKLRNIWIVKPGELSNRGNGITVIDELYEIESMLNKKEKHQNGTTKTFIVQLYIDRPLLYNNRKFDIRHYMLITNMFGVMRGYWYQEGYIRTASYEFDVYTFDKQIHLTNDAVQKHTPLYGKYQQGNKLSYSQLQRFLDAKYPKKDFNFDIHILPKMKRIATDSIRSAYLKLSPENKENNFEIFGLDFMIDADFKPWLIEINTNPCLQLSSPLLERIIPMMVESSLRLSLDIMFPPPGHYPNTSKHLVPDVSLQNLKYELIFDSLSEGLEVQSLYRDIKTQKLMDQIGAVSDEEEEFDDNGEEVKLEDF